MANPYDIQGYDLQRFLDAQDPVYAQVCSELRHGQKAGHWMWFIFPELRGLGHSQMAETFGISSREEAVAYLEHPILGERLRSVTSGNQVFREALEKYFGGELDPITVQRL